MKIYRKIALPLFLILTLSSIFLMIISPYFMILALFLFIITSVIITDINQKEHSLLRNFPLIGRLRWVFEDQRSKIQQYFVENDLNGTPFNREVRSDVYQKSKGDNNNVPFGTQLDVYKKGYEYIRHSMYPKSIDQVEIPTITFGSKFTKVPYTTSILNISAMSYGALSDAAIKALNGGAKMGGFYHNTGEGGISRYHLENGGDLVFQIGTGYFGCGKTFNGVRIFDPLMFKINSNIPNVKMIEVKLSQGAKPGKGGILPASKNTKEISEIRGIEPHTDVMSPPNHNEFSNNSEMLQFIQKLRELSNGKPVGIKMCVGNFDEVKSLVKEMKKNDIYPDFITIDGSEGGTGSSPLVYTNYMGTPLFKGLELVDTLLKKYNLREDIKIIVSGKLATSFDIIKALSMGADSINSARPFMLSLGCIQARECDKDTCPVGISTQDKSLIKGLDSNVKKVRVYNYHKSLIKEIRSIIGSMGLTSVNDLNSSHIIKN